MFWKYKHVKYTCNREATHTGCWRASPWWWRSPWVSWWLFCNRGRLCGSPASERATHPDGPPAQPAAIWGSKRQQNWTLGTANVVELSSGCSFTTSKTSVSWFTRAGLLKQKAKSKNECCFVSSLKSICSYVLAHSQSVVIVLRCFGFFRTGDRAVILCLGAILSFPLFELLGSSLWHVVSAGILLNEELFCYRWRTISFDLTAFLPPSSCSALLPPSVRSLSTFLNDRRRTRPQRYSNNVPSIYQYNHGKKNVQNLRSVGNHWWWWWWWCTFATQKEQNQSPAGTVVILGLWQ